MLSVAVAGWPAASATPGPVAALVGDPVAGAASPGPTGGPGRFTPARGKQSSAGSGAEGADQIQVPATSGSTVQLGLLRGPAATRDSLSAVHGRGRLRPQASTAPPPPEQGERPPYLGQLDGLLAHLHLGADIPDPKGEHLLRHRPPPFPSGGEIQRHLQTSFCGQSEARRGGGQGTSSVQTRLVFLLTPAGV